MAIFKTIKINPVKNKYKNSQILKIRINFTKHNTNSHKKKLNMECKH